MSCLSIRFLFIYITLSDNVQCSVRYVLVMLFQLAWSNSICHVEDGDAREEQSSKEDDVLLVVLKR
jgi:hypothetical protein